MDFKSGINIKIIGDSLATGEGASDSVEIDELILENSRKCFYKRSGKKGWAQQLELYIKNNYPMCSVKNNGCGGINSREIIEAFDELYCKSDDLVILIVGANDRKYYGGMEALKANLLKIIAKIRQDGNTVMLMTPIPSTVQNENYPNRLYHMEDVNRVVVEVALSTGVILVDNYKYINSYLRENNITIEELMSEEGCISDGLHPTDSVHNLIYNNLLSVMKNIYKI